jgi:hypothetical protein
MSSIWRDELYLGVFLTLILMKNMDQVSKKHLFKIIFLAD